MSDISTEPSPEFVLSLLAELSSLLRRFISSKPINLFTAFSASLALSVIPSILLLEPSAVSDTSFKVSTIFVCIPNEFKRAVIPSINFSTTLIALFITGINAPAITFKIFPILTFKLVNEALSFATLPL